MLRPYYQRKGIEVGCDEAGRGCLAGPVFAAAVILPKDFQHRDLDDSKKISEELRATLKHLIKEKAIAWSVAFVQPVMIDRINILNASFLAMHKALNKLNHSFDKILVDGNRFNPYKKVPHHCIIKGDGIFASIAAASILAKTHRDAYMKRKDRSFPQYGWKQNKGYPTQAHRAALQQHGPSAMHRQSFRLNYTEDLLNSKISAE